MNLVETSFVNKFENNIGESIFDVGGEVPFDLHWLPFLDESIKDQLFGNFIIDEKIYKRVDEKFNELGMSQESINAWNEALNRLDRLEERVSFIEESPAMTIEQQDIDDWNISSHWNEDN